LADDVDDRDQWLVEPLIPAHRLTAIVAKGGVGKSLIMLEIAAALATGMETLLRSAGAPLSVIYIDMEMTPDDLAERLTEMGCEFADDQVLQENLHYYLLQDFKPFDTRRGGEQLLAVVERHEAELVIIDTLARVVEGDENEANTYHNFAAFTGKLLKAKGVAVVRLDHIGKNPKKGPRGSSAKRDDVDVAWMMSNQNDPTKVKFKADKRRVEWVPAQVDVVRNPGPPLKHEIKQTALSEKVAALMTELDKLGVPTDAGRDKARKALTDAEIQASNADLADAVAARKRRGGQPDSTSS
jgi:hypothetical protein